MQVKLTLDTQKIALSSESRIYKTEGFVSKTRKVAMIDAFVSRVSESAFLARLPFGCHAAVTEGGLYTVMLCIRGGQFQSDIIFYDFVCTADEGGFDRRLRDLFDKKRIELTVHSAKEEVKQEDLQRLYLVSGSDGTVNFPFLNQTQRKIVETEDSNMLVQGVAGSGKTNVCVEKIVYSACRNYRGKVLYTTFSRGLLQETKSRVELFVKNINDLVAAYESGNVVFLDDNHKKAVENKLGISFDVDEDGEIFSAIKRIAAFLSDKVEYRLIEDIYSARFDFSRELNIANDSVFIEYIGGKATRVSGAMDRIKNISPEIVYKEIYGMIFGKYDVDAPQEMMTLEEYIDSRSGSFTRKECEAIYAVAQDYAEFLKKQGYTDNNIMSREIIADITSPSYEYSLGVIDEVQDFTQVNLCLMNKLCRKLFCVGDALQMINPSYFSFAYLKRLMYGEVTGVSELKHNYRSTQRIERIAEALGRMNIQRFGTHSFVLQGESVPSPLKSEAVFVKDKSFVHSLGEKRFENLTVIVGSQSKKDRLKKVLGKTEILTVAEAKGLERNTVVLADVLSDNAEKWRQLHELTINRKTADENSVYRYYFNLFYVGISRARQHLFVVENDYPKFFDKLFDECFSRRSKDNALNLLKDIAGRIEIDDDEFVERIKQFCSLEQYDNARAAADRLSSEELRAKQLVYISVHQKHLRFGRYRDAGVEYWRHGLDGEAREMFTRSGDTQLFPLMDACLQRGGALDPEIVRFFPLVEDNDVAKNIIIETLQSDSKDIETALKAATATLRRKF